MANKSIGQMILQIEGLLGTRAVNDWESEFIESVVEKTQQGKVTTGLSSKQVESIEKIYSRNFA